MKGQHRRSAIGLATLSLATSMMATAGTPRVQVDDIAAATGLTRSEVRMVLGARTPYFEYITSYERSRQRMVQVLGKQRFRDLMAGREIVLDDGRRLALLAR